MKNIILKIIISICKFFLSIVYGIMKLRKTRNQVLLLSRQSDKESLDFKLLREGLEKENIKVITMYRMIHPGIKEKLSYSLYMFKILQTLAVSKVCILDGYSIPVSLLNHKKDLTIIQMWHALGATKKFGYQSLDTKEGSSSNIAKIMSMHKNYDYVLAPSKKTGEFFAQAFNTPYEKMQIIGLPRVDYLKQKDEALENKIYEKYPKLKEKEIILYVPTFRKIGSINLDDLISNVNKEKYSLIIRKHPLEANDVPEENKIEDKYKTTDLLKIADYVITDYSAIAYEAAMLGKKLYFYIYDIENYQETRGLNVDLEQEMNQETFKDGKELIEAIEKNQYNYDELKEFRNKYVEVYDKENVLELVKLIKDNLKK